MRHSYVLLVFILFLATIRTSFGQRNINRFEIESKAVQCRYDIEVVIPQGTPPSGIQYPVIYCMDWFILGDFFKSLPKMMALGNLTEPFVLVGISQGQNTDDWAVMRTRDYTPAYPTDEYSKNILYPKALKLAGGAKKFTIFLKEELIPTIESKYPADPARRCFVGYSFGGLLGVHLLTSDPRLFQYYLLGSPSLWFNNFSLASELEELPMDSLKMIMKTYVSVGEEESWEMLKSFDVLRSAIRQKGIEESKVKTEIIDEAGHVGGMPISLYNGIRFLFQNEH